jgi:hypothetical protein
MGFRTESRSRKDGPRILEPKKDWPEPKKFYNTLLKKMKSEFSELKVNRGQTNYYPPSFPVEGTVRVVMQESGSGSTPNVGVSAPFESEGMFGSVWITAYAFLESRQESSCPCEVCPQRDTCDHVGNCPMAEAKDVEIWGIIYDKKDGWAITLRDAAGKEVSRKVFGDDRPAAIRFLMKLLPEGVELAHDVDGLNESYMMVTEGAGTPQPPGEYIVTYKGVILGLLNFGGSRYYSDEPPWETPKGLAEYTYKKRKEAVFGGGRFDPKKLKVRDSGSHWTNAAGEDAYEVALERERAWDPGSRKYGKLPDWAAF